MSSLALLNDESYDFLNSKELIDFVDLRKNDKNFMEEIRFISFYNDWRNDNSPIITISDDFFYNMINVSCVHVFSNDILPKNAFKYSRCIKTFTCFSDFPNLQYLGFNDDNPLEWLEIESKYLNDNYFPVCNKLEYLCAYSDVFSGNCFKNLVALKTLEVSGVCNKLHLEDFILNSTTLTHLYVFNCDVTVGGININVPSIKSVDVGSCSELLNEITKTSFRIEQIDSSNNNFHFSQLFDKTELEIVDLVNSDICNENLIEFENNKKLEEIKIRGNKKVCSRELPGNLKNIVKV